MSRTAYVNARLMDPSCGRDETGSLLVVDGYIDAIGADLPIPPETEIIDCKGQILAPGLVDMHSFQPDFNAAAAGGITRLVLIPDQSVPLDDAAKIAQVAHSGSNGVMVHPLGAATKGLQGSSMAELGLMSEAGAVGFGDGRRAIADSQMMRRLLEYARLFNRPIIQHAQDPSLAKNGVMTEGETATRLGLAGIPAVAEVMMIERDARLVELTGGRLHHAQISTAASLDAIRRNKARELPMSCGVSPQHFILNETAVADYRTFAKLSPPLRSEADRAAIVEAIREGLIDVICSAHDPQDQENKRLPFAEAAHGAVGYQTLLALSLSLYHGYDVDLMQILAMLSTNPARILGLDAGTLAPGARADFILFDLNRPWRINPEDFLSETQNTPFEGQPVQGNLSRTVIAGETVFMGGKP
ncbi:dihydroorotase [Iodidimonas gelatinilytica]|uniref:Dihydroorotase n=1 Tax=Iodidimonas gelatinilytica TaxID=1236966 RepID=A0A5A7N406_9PROT|nr:dihydroorotase [Iodidimonas gelatinilytica]GER02100.1 dihydroorotase [Iodidimonas gelatinilytica]